MFEGHRCLLILKRVILSGESDRYRKNATNGPPVVIGLTNTPSGSSSTRNNLSGSCCCAPVNSHFQLGSGSEYPRGPVATTNDLRCYPRFLSPKGTLLAWQSARKKLVSRVDNLGLGGLYIRTLEPPPPGSFIQLLLDVPAGEVRARALVQRSKPNEGMGVKFIAMQQEDRGRFVRWLKSLGRS